MVCYKMCALASDQGWLRHCLDAKVIDRTPKLSEDVCKHTMSSGEMVLLFLNFEQLKLHLSWGA